MKLKSILCVLTIVHGVLFSAQTLSRRAFLGIQMENVNEEVQRVMKLSVAQGVLISQVISGSTAEAAGFLKSDILLKFGETEVKGRDDVFAALKNFNEGGKIEYTLLREGKLISKALTIKGIPKESYKDLDVIYGQVKVGDDLLRSIVTKPKKQGKYPAVLFIQGIGCNSYDTPMDTERADIQLLNQLARNGYVVMRVDKSGMGDSKGPPCDKLDFITELEGYKQAFATMRDLNYVDSQNCFVFGHSMGGVMAPLVAKSENVKGIVVYGTMGVNFMEYWMNTRKTIAQAYKLNAIETDDYIKEQCECASMLLTAKMKKEEIIKVNKECEEAINVLLLRDYQYWYQLYQVNTPKNWSEYNGKVLSIWGTSDFITSKEEHLKVRDVVNTYHPGNAGYAEVQEAGHAFQTASDYVEAKDNPGPYNREVGKTLVNWLKTVNG